MPAAVGVHDRPPPPGASVAQAASSDESASRAVGEGPIDQAAGLPSKQSRTAEKYAFEPQGRRNSVMSVTQSTLGAGAVKSWVPSARGGRFGLVPAALCMFSSPITFLSIRAPPAGFGSSVGAYFRLRGW